MKSTYQRHKRCAIDNPGLPNDSAGSPGLLCILWGTMVIGVALSLLSHY